MFLFIIFSFQGMETLFDGRLDASANLPIVLISEGAECLLISKSFFLRNANAQVINCHPPYSYNFCDFILFW